MAVGLFAAGCYDVPKPDCGFRCGPGTECPDGYTCASDGRCHRDGSDPGLACPTVDAGTNGYSPRIVASMPMPGDVIDQTASLNVTFDVDVAGVSESSFLVVIRDTQTQLDGIVSYDAFARRASLLVLGMLPASEQFDLILTSEIFDPRTSNVLMEPPIGFATGTDTRAPQITSANPADGAIGIPVDANIVLRFDEQVTGANSTYIRLSDTAMRRVSVTYSSAQRTALVDPTFQLAPNTQYTVTANSGGIFDKSNNPLVPFSMMFTTGADSIPPNVHFAHPGPGSGGVPLGTDIEIHFDEPVMNASAANVLVNEGAIAGTVTFPSAYRILFTPAELLPAASVITVSLGNTITDLSGNPLAPTMFSFETQ